MIKSSHLYTCFWLSGINSDAAKSASKFLEIELEELKKYGETKDDLKLKGGIIKGYDPEALNENIIAHQWLQQIIAKREDDENFRASAEDKKKVLSFANINCVLSWHFDSLQYGKDLDYSLHVFVIRDNILFRKSYSQKFLPESEKIGLKPPFGIPFKKEIDVTHGELFQAKFSQVTGGKDDWKQTEWQKYFKNHISFGKKEPKWQIGWKNKIEESESGNIFTGTILCAIDESMQTSTELKSQKNSGQFLDHLCEVIISKQKVFFENRLLSDSKCDKIETEYKRTEKELDKIYENITTSFIPSITLSEFSWIQNQQADILKLLEELSTLFNTSLKNRNHFINYAPRYFNQKDKWLKDSIRDLNATTDNLHTLYTSLSRRANWIQKSIELLMVIGTREISLNYSSELINVGNSTFGGAQFSPQIKSKDITVFRPTKIENAKFGSLNKHYLEALHQLSGTELKRLIEAILSPLKEFQLVFSNPLKKRTIEKLSIGKLLESDSESFDAEEFLQEMRCDQINNKIENNPKKCHLCKLSAEDIESLAEDDDRYQYWVGVNSMISLFEALSLLYINPNHHISVIAKDNYQNRRGRLRFILGLLCLKVNYYEKARKYFDEAIQLAHQVEQFDWAFSVAQIAGLCESCESFNCPPDVDHQKSNNGSTSTESVTSQIDKSYRKRLASHFLEVFDFPKAAAITRSSQKSKKYHFKDSYRPRASFWGIAALVLFGLLLSTFLIYKPGICSEKTVSGLAGISWFFALIGAPVALTIGTIVGWKFTLIPKILYPKNLAAITITIVSFSFSSELIVSMISKNRIPIIISVGIVSFIFPPIFLYFRFRKLDRKSCRRFGRIFDLLSISFLEASMISAICLFLYGPMFEQRDPKFVLKIFGSDLFIASPVFILLASMVAVFFGVAIKTILHPIGCLFSKKDGNT